MIKVWLLLPIVALLTVAAFMAVVAASTLIMGLVCFTLEWITRRLREAIHS